uniref:Superoxide dismutase n=1 Tax=Anthurium amnicola TaxID=1678845 RepID=A0A1D1XUN0_9ARAE
MAFRTLLAKKALGIVPRHGAVELGLRPGPGLCQLRSLQTFSLPDLPYDYGALEPAISGEIMGIHHQKHHQAYITNYNKAQEQLAEAMAKGDTSKVVGLQGAIKFNGGGHVNHSIFWKNLAPTNEGGGEPPKGALGWAIDTDFGSLEALIQKMNVEGASLQGSGWVWLALDKELKKVKIETTANQDPLVTKGLHLVPLLGIDVWEHAYYLQYKNVRPDYLKNIWNVINWKYASEVYEKQSA